MFLVFYNQINDWLIENYVATLFT